MSLRVYIGFDDTDNQDSDFGTGKIARRFENVMPEGCRVWGVVRQQLLIDERIPYTSHNSSACVVIDLSEPSLKDDLIFMASEYIEREAAPGSDPGLCLACESDIALTELMSFGPLCTRQIVTQKEALQAASGIHISGHGGSNDGIIGAAAAVGLTASGWSGRFIEFAGLRRFPDTVAVWELEKYGIIVVSLDRDAMVPAPADVIYTKGWLRPRLWGQRPILPVLCRGKNMWESVGEKRKKS
jgi:tRNA(Ile2) C34 agmatinyltransferase TiaS